MSSIEINNLKELLMNNMQVLGNVQEFENGGLRLKGTKGVEHELSVFTDEDYFELIIDSNIVENVPCLGDNDEFVTYTDQQKNEEFLQTSKLLAQLQEMENGQKINHTGNVENGQKINHTGNVNNFSANPFDEPINESLWGLYSDF